MTLKELYANIRSHEISPDSTLKISARTIEHLMAYDYLCSVDLEHRYTDHVVEAEIDR